MMRTHLSLIAAVILAACSETSALEPARNGAAEPSFSASPTRPAGGSCTFASAVLPAEPGQPPNVRRLHIDEECQLMHLGRAIGSAEETATFTPAGPIITNRTTYTAANGDQLFVTFNGSGTPPQNGVVTFSGTETVTGGTGRFAGASGALARTGSVSVLTQTGEFETRGSLSY
jgi:hypothetical protein